MNYTALGALYQLLSMEEVRNLDSIAIGIVRSGKITVEKSALSDNLIRIITELGMEISTISWDYAIVSKQQQFKTSKNLGSLVSVS